MRTVGAISLERGEQARLNGEPGSDRLIRCVLIECTRCGARDHTSKDLRGSPMVCRCGARQSHKDYLTSRAAWGLPHVFTTGVLYGTMLRVEKHWHLRPR